MSEHHKHKVEDTRKRSCLKALTGRAIEIAVGSFIIAFILSRNLALSAGVALINETVCAFISYLNDRAWNRIQWGRKVKNISNGKEDIVKKIFDDSERLFDDLEKLEESKDD